MQKETQEERIFRRKKEGFHNPKKDKWARRLRYIERRLHSLNKLSEDNINIVEKKISWLRRFLKWIKKVFKRSN